MTLLAAVADSAQHAGDLALQAHALDVSEYLKSWHEFYLLTGTAAVTLVGLLFVSLSFHLDALLHESRAHLLSVARQAMLNFIGVLIISLSFLAPGITARPLGMNIFIISAIFFMFGMSSLIRALRRRDSSRHSAFVLRRSMIGNIGFAASAWVGFRMLSHRDATEAVWLIGTMCMILGNAVGTAWDLLVRVGRLKQEIVANDSKS
jgi:hypothetical protein